MVAVDIYVYAALHVQYRCFPSSFCDEVITLRISGVVVRWSVHQVGFVMRALSNHPAQITCKDLEARLAGVGADGAVCLGGEDATHRSTGAGELFLVHVYDPQEERGVFAAPHALKLTNWDLFHRIDVATKHAILAPLQQKRFLLWRIPWAHCLESARDA